MKGRNNYTAINHFIVFSHIFRFNDQLASASLSTHPAFQHTNNGGSGGGGCSNLIKKTNNMQTASAAQSAVSTESANEMTKEK